MSLLGGAAASVQQQAGSDGDPMLGGLAVCTGFRQWRPFPGQQLDIICEEGCIPTQCMHVYEEFRISVAQHPVRIVDALGRAEEVRPDSIAITNPAEVHAIVALPHTVCTTRVVRVAAQTVASVWNLQERRDTVPVFTPRAVHDQMLATELHALFDELRRPLISLECRDRVFQWLQQLVAGYATTELPINSDAPRYMHSVRRVRDYLRVHVTKPVSIDDLARLAGLSKFYLLRQFEREYGVSPHIYQMELRLARACTLLSRGATPSAAAYSAGFADQSHLTRRMKATFGVTPGVYARWFATAAIEPARARTSIITTRRRIESAA